MIQSSSCLVFVHRFARFYKFLSDYWLHVWRRCDADHAMIAVRMVHPSHPYTSRRVVVMHRGSGGGGSGRLLLSHAEPRQPRDH